MLNMKSPWVKPVFWLALIVALSTSGREFYDLLVNVLLASVRPA